VIRVSVRLSLCLCRSLGPFFSFALEMFFSGLALLALGGVSVQAANLTVAAKGGNATSPLQYGIMFEVCWFLLLLLLLPLVFLSLFLFNRLYFSSEHLLSVPMLSPRYPLVYSSFVSYSYFPLGAGHNPLA
jgi:hypothetical protein